MLGIFVSIRAKTLYINTYIVKLLLGGMIKR